MSFASRLERWWVALPLLTLVLLFPTLVHQRPFVFWDTEQYYDYGGELFGALNYLLGSPAAGVAPQTTDLEQRAAPADEAPAGDRTHFEQKSMVAGVTYYGARSPFYSAWLYATAQVLGLWGVVITQAAAIAWLIWRASTLVAPERRFATALATTGIATLGSTAWFVAGFVMPDAYAAVGLLCIALLFAFADKMGIGERLALVALLAASAAFHTTHLATAAAVGALGAALLLRSDNKLRLRRAGLAIAGALAMVVAAQLVFDAASRAALGTSVKKPPFLMARIIDDGPGWRYLNEVCPQKEAFAVCKYRDREGVRGANEFLWDGEIGVFTTLPYEGRIELIEEEWRFVAAVFRKYPIETVGAAAANVLELLTHVAPLEAWVDPGAAFKMPSFESASLFEVAPFLYQCVSAPRSCMPTIPYSLVLVVVAATTIVSLGTIAAHFLVRTRTILSAAQGDDTYDRVVLFSLVVLCGLLVNAVLCGTFSGPFYRYQARVIWLTVVAAALLEVSRPLALTWLQKTRLARG